MRRLLALGALVLAGCTAALAQTAAVAPLAAEIPWGQVVGALGILAGALGALVKVAHDLLAKLYIAIGAVDARAAAFEAGIRDGFAAGLLELRETKAELREIKVEQRRSSDAAIHTADRLDTIDRHVDRIRGKMGDDPTAEVPRPAAR